MFSQKNTKQHVHKVSVVIANTISHGEDVDAAAADDDYIAFVVFACQKTFFYLLCEIVFAMTTET